MEHRILGSTGLRVSAISLGTVELGLDYGIGGRKPAEDDARRLLERALDLGINFIDTARAYGSAEEIIGRAIASRRRDFVLATKVQPSADVERSVEESLRLLRTDAVDILYLHAGPNDTIAVDDRLLRVRQRGLCRFLGASVYGIPAAENAVAAGIYDCLQIAHSALDRRPESAALGNLGIVARSVLLKGALTHRWRKLPPQLQSLREAAQTLEALGYPLPELAYRYVLNHPGTHSALAGTASLEELEQVVSFASMGPLPAHVVDAIRALPMPPEFDLNPGNWPDIPH